MTAAKEGNKCEVEEAKEEVEVRGEGERELGC